MKTIITYGTFDLFHYGHYLLLRRAKALGDRLIVGVSTDKMSAEKGKVCILPEEVRMDFIRNLRFVDDVIPEENMAQKVEDIQKYGVDVFVLGSDYREKFREMPEYEAVAGSCEIQFLERTPDISTSDLKEKLMAQLKTVKKL